MKIIPQIKYNSVLTEFTDIEERNYAFNNLDAQSQRLEMAWDALQMVVGRKVKSAHGAYWSWNLKYISEYDPKKFQQRLLDLPPKCEVCQRGLMMLAQIRLGNEVSCSDDYRIKGREGNVKGFSMSDMYSMESEYESSVYGHPHLSRSTKKLANICCNVLVNGNFYTLDDTNYLSIEP